MPECGGFTARLFMQDLAVQTAVFLACLPAVSYTHLDVYTRQKKERIEELERKIEEPNFWDNPEESQHTMKLLRSLQDSVKKIEKMYADYEDIGLLIEMSEEEPDDETIEEIREDLERFQEEFEELRIGTLLTGEYDRNDAIMSIHAGAGGTESCDWASMLYRMYTCLLYTSRCV